LLHQFLSDAVPIAYVDIAPTGEDRREPILLIHGFASNHLINWISTGWHKTLAHDGRRVIAFDNRGHGASGKLYDPADYATETMAGDAARLLAHLGIERADVMGYSMGARIAAFLALDQPQLVRSLILGGLGHHLVDGVGLPLKIAEAMEAPSLDALSDPMQRLFRKFADGTQSDLKALAACIRGSRQTLSPGDVAAILTPALVAIGTRDEVAGDPHELAAMMGNATAFDIEGRDHNLAVGDRTYKAVVLEFLRTRP
jgi:pimeloyl-ACP methyl ester carboxylesterase